MSSDKPSTSDILSKIRGGGTPSQPAEEVKPADAPAAEAPTETPEVPAAPAPTGTGSILDSIRAGKPAGTADAAKPAAAAPSGTSGILASIRGGGGPAAAPAAKPAAAKKPAASVDTAKASGMSAADMIAAARKGIVTADPVTGEKKPVEKKVALPSKPLPGKMPLPKAGKRAAPAETRRSVLLSLAAVLLSPVVIGWGSLVTALSASGLAIARFMMPEAGALIEPPTKFKIGPPTEYGAGTVSTKWKAQFGVWVVNDEIDGQQMIYALSTVCTHLGCTPNWLEGEQKFKCPCHGSGFYRTGVNFEGPAPRPLERHGVRLAEDGMLEVDKSVKFQAELGQWENSASFVPV